MLYGCFYLFLFIGGAINSMNGFNVSNFIINDFLNLFILLLFSLVLACLLVLFSYLLIHQKPDSEKISIYECGYEPYENTRHVFNIRFYLIAIFFIVFDIEILYMMPWCLSVSKGNLLNFWSMIDFVFELNLGFFYIWYNNSLNWE